MKIEEQAKKYGITSLELSKQLKANGYEQKGLLYWCNTIEGIKLCYKVRLGIRYVYGILGEIGTEVTERSLICVAPTIAELGEIISLIKGSGIDWSMNIFRTNYKEINKTWVVGNRTPLRDATWYDYAKTEANARAKMWLCLDEKGLL